MQPDGKILAGGFFTNLAGQARNRIGRLNADGTLDGSFNPGANNWVRVFAVQADGKVLVGGQFTNLAGQVRNYIGRLNADGTLDAGFNPDANDWVDSIVVQTDGKILVSGWFTHVAGQTRNRIARLNPDGTLDLTFDPNASYGVSALALQADGKILAGGYFDSLCGQPHNYLARLNNTGPATQDLSWDGLTITWLRTGTGPECWRTTFDATDERVVWTNLGTGSRISGGWQLTGVTSGQFYAIRARGFVAGGVRDGSGWFVEAIAEVPRITSQPVSQTNAAGTTASFNLVAAGSEPLTYRWRKDGVNLTDGGNIAGATTATLTVSNVQAGDAGGYAAGVSNSCGSATSAVARLKVLVVPTVSVNWLGVGGTNVSISLSSVPGLNYRLEFKSSLDDANWTPLLPEVLGDGGIISLQDTNGTLLPSRFYRVRCE